MQTCVEWKNIVKRQGALLMAESLNPPGKKRETGLVIHQEETTGFNPRIPD